MQMGDASEAVNVANGHMVCGCDNVDYCRVSSSEFLELWVNIISFKGFSYYFILSKR